MRSQKGYVINILTILMLVFSFQCGYYSFSGSTLPSHIRTVAVPMFENRTSEYGVREEITDQLIVKFTQDNTLKVSDQRSANSIINGSITNIREQAGAYNVKEQVKEIKVYITIQASFEDLKKREKIWEEQITEWGVYNPNLPSGQEGSMRDDAIQEAIDKLVDDIFNKTISGW